ncbi:MAG: hypothetical protein IPN68_15935 [Bacteroidetes bacterium]|nr:hypothetical protein [Bacteroidota bacterium]
MNLLGNGLAKDIAFIQWYEYTGTGESTLWILLSNYFLAQHIIRLYSSGKELLNCSSMDADYYCTPQIFIMAI